MKPPDNENGPGEPQDPGADHDTIRRRQRPHRRDQDRSVLAITGPIVDCLNLREIGPDARRAQPVFIVLVCPYECGDQHVHRGAPGVRRSPCRRGRYRVGPVTT